MQIRLSILTAVLACAATAQKSPHDSSARADMRAILSKQADIPVARARQQCLSLPVDPPDDRLAGPHGSTLLTTRCEVESYQAIQTAWAVAHYRWISTFTAEDKTRGPTAVDNVTENEAVLFETSLPGQVPPVWHQRYETGAYAVLASVTPEIAVTARNSILLSVMSCVNGTGGCSQEFLARRMDGSWFPVWQDWLDQLPAGFMPRIRHGVRIDPITLRGEAGFYSDGDPNCCPSETVAVDLELRGDSIRLIRHNVRRNN